ncbi:transglutaminase family protein [Dapis sp. BLCC M229]|uniref:transglutaminase family protein n=1 Tax=Dapis sp. BLCC M229 TaxID=3400188 RepID=UPI003CF7991C
MLHPAIESHSPLVFEIVDSAIGRSIGGCSYYVSPPNGKVYQEFPPNHREAESRMVERFIGIMKMLVVFHTRREGKI